MGRHGVRQAIALQYAGFYNYSMQGSYLHVCIAGFLFFYFYKMQGLTIDCVVLLHCVFGFVPAVFFIVGARLAVWLT